MSEFLLNNKNEINKLCECSANSLSSLDLKSNELSVSQCIEIVGNIHKVIHSNNVILGILGKEEPSKRIEHIVETTIYILGSNNVLQIINKEQADTVKNFCNKSENVTVVLKLVNWVSDNLLPKIDNDGDGKITKEELKDCCGKVCPCFGNKIGDCWAWTCLTVCCCGKDEYQYKK